MIETNIVAYEGTYIVLLFIRSRRDPEMPSDPRVQVFKPVLIFENLVFFHCRTFICEQLGYLGNYQDVRKVSLVFILRK